MSTQDDRAGELPRRRRGSLALRISVLAAAVAVITALVGGVLSLNLVRAENARSARQSLARAATVVANQLMKTGANGRPSSKAAARVARARLGTNDEAIAIRLAAIVSTGKAVSFGYIDSAGVVHGDVLVRAALTAGQQEQLRSSGRAVSRSTHAPNGDPLYVEARATSFGAIILAQRRTDALAATNQALNRIIVGLLVGVAIAIALGLLVAWRLARPLRRTAQAAHALADGHRDVQVVVQGPAEVAEVGAAVNSLATALTVSEQRQRQFLLSVSHDLRTPLTAISGYAELLGEDAIPAADVAHVGRVMLDESHRLNRLVGDLLDLARLDAQDFRVDAVPTDLRAMAQAAAQVWHQRCSAAGVRFVLEAPAEPVVAVTDAARVRQIADGLLENALRVTPASALIVLAVRPGPRSVVLEVRDGGPGLTDDDLAVAFDQSALYDRYRGVRKVGTGLGLAIVHRLVGRLGGAVEAGHAPEGGARFTVWLPA